jgi:hypothetical protein
MKKTKNTMTGLRVTETGQVAEVKASGFPILQQAWQDYFV